MSWAITFNKIDKTTQVPADVYEKMITQHIKYSEDIATALKMAIAIGMQSGTISGCRTPNPTGGPEVIDISLRGLIEPADFNTEMRKILRTGP